MSQTLLPWIGGASAPGDLKLTPLISPIDGKPVAQIAESDAAAIDAAVKNAHATYLANRESKVATRVAWLNACADAIEKAEKAIVESLVVAIGKPRRAATFEAKRGPQFLRATAAQLPHMLGEVLPLDAAALGAGRFGFTTRIPYGVVAAITAFNAPANLRSEEHTSELQSLRHLVCRLLLEKKKNKTT